MVLHLSRRQLLTIGAAVGGVAAAGLPAALNPTAAQAYTVPAKMQWWYAARFGMFIHFGSYSYLGRGEWVMNNENWSKANYHAQVTANFNPTSFNAATVVGLARAAGMRYLVITAKHHEGFSMWDTAVTGFRGSDGRAYDLPGYTAYRGDLLGALKAECDRQGIKFCLYYSILDWSHPSQTRRSDALTTMSSMTARANYIADMKAQLRELLDRYDPAVLWFDGDWGPDPAPPHPHRLVDRRGRAGPVQLPGRPQARAGDQRAGQARHRPGGLPVPGGVRAGDAAGPALGDLPDDERRLGLQRRSGGQL